MTKQLLFSVTKKDFTVETTRGSGNGGQNRNKVETAVRITHAASGATGYSETHRTQLQNKKTAFERLTNSQKFKQWHKLECSRRLGQVRPIEDIVNELMNPENIKVDYLEV